jgi:methionyl-tRNA formyltransferase
VSGGILFVGGGPVGSRVLGHLLRAGHPVAAVVGMRDHAHESAPAEPVMRELCAAHGVAYAGADLGGQALAGVIREHGTDFLLTTGYRRLIPAEVYGLCERGAVGSHFSLLPRYRGFAPLNWAVLNGARRTGVSLFHLAPGMDAGDLVDQAELEVGEDETAAELMERATALFVQVLDRHLPALLMGSAPRRAQDEAEATYTCARVPDDGVIDWNWPARRIHALVRALSHPFPGAWTLHGGRKLFVWQTRLLEAPRRYVGLVPGRVIGTVGDAVQVLAGDGPIELLRVQPEGEAEVDAARLLRSVRDTVGR